MIAIDTNLLVYAHRTDSPHHAAALGVLEQLALSSRRVGLPWPCVHEFLAISTHPRVYQPPSPVADALAAVDDLLASAAFVPLPESSDHAEILRRLLESSSVVGPKVHDARIAAICIGNGINELWSADRDFSAFPALRTINPLGEMRG